MFASSAIFLLKDRCGKLFPTNMIATGRGKSRLLVPLILIISLGLYLATKSLLGWTSQIKKHEETPKQDRREVTPFPSATTTSIVYNESIWTRVGPRYDCTDIEDDVEENESSVYGKPIYAQNKTVLYISMPKCGSRTFVWTLGLLREAHHFGKPVNIQYLLATHPVSEMRDILSSKLHEAQDGAILHGHYRYINMKRSPKKPILMSMIRDPIDRFESHFYFIRHGDLDMSKEQLQKNIKVDSNMALPNETLDECVEKGREECTISLYRNLYITSFCGYSLGCSKSPSYALKQAKLNVDKFLVIGVMEEYDLSMAVFEKLLPETFGGAAKIYQESKSKPMEKFKTTFKKLPSQKTYSILKERMKYDYEFYDYVKKRLHRVARRLGVGQCSSMW